jgi:16S rRNA (guanine527-N7)-methyltransferase
MRSGKGWKPSSVPEKVEVQTEPFWRIPEWFPELNSSSASLLKAFRDELLFFNNKISLISPGTLLNSDSIHFADGILGSQIVFSQLKQKEIYDFGSGNGVPGIVFACLYPGINVKLVESDTRKNEYLKHCISKLGLKNCSAILARIEDLAQESVKAVMARGLASVSKSIILARKCTSVNGQFFHFKGPSWPSEIGEIPSQVLSSWDVQKLGDYRLFDSGQVMSIILTTRSATK